MQIIVEKCVFDEFLNISRCHCGDDAHIGQAMDYADAYTTFETQGRALPLLIKGDALSLLRDTFGGSDDPRELIAQNRETINAIVHFLIDEDTHWQWSIEIDRETMLRWGRQRDLWHWKPV